MPIEARNRVDGERTFAEWRATPYKGSGPFPSTRLEESTLPTHTLYYPEDLSKAPRLPIVLWANGGCRNTSVEFTHFLGQLASSGYFVIAVGRNDVPFAYFRPGDPVPGPGQTPLHDPRRRDPD